MSWKLSICALLFSSCTIGGRTLVRETNGNPWVPGEDFALTEGDRQNTRKPASIGRQPGSESNTSILRELKEREGRLSSWEVRQYEKIRPLLKTPSERIYYLGLSPQERQEYELSRFPFLGKTNPGPPRGRDLAPVSFEKNRPIALDMGKREVINLWGQPSRIDIAGNPSWENERWIFFQGGSRKMVYFEKGRVQGWSLID